MKQVKCVVPSFRLWSLAILNSERVEEMNRRIQHSDSPGGGGEYEIAPFAQRMTETFPKAGGVELTSFQEESENDQ